MPHIQSSTGFDALAFSSINVFNPESAGDLWAIQITRRGTLINTYAAESLSFTLNKKPPHTVEWEISHSHPGVGHDFIRPKYHDFLLLKGDIPIIAGPVTDFAVTGLDAENSSFAGKDWSVYLDNRHYPFNPNNPHPPAAFPGSANDFVIGSPPLSDAYQANNTDVHTILKNVLDKILSRPYSLAMTYPSFLVALGITTNYELSLADTSSFLSIMDSLSDIDPGFVYEVLTTKEIVTYSPQKYDPGVATDPFLAQFIINTTTEENAAALLDVSFANTGPGGTHILGTGSGIDQNRVGSALSAPASQSEYRRWDETVDFGDVKNRAAVVARTKRVFSHDLNPQHEIEVTVDPNEITDFWLKATAGAAFWLDVDLVSHRIQSAQEMVSIRCSVDENGEETAVIACNQIYPVGSPGIGEG